MIVDRHTMLLSLDDNPTPQIAGCGQCSVAPHRLHLIGLIARLSLFSRNLGEVEIFENDGTRPLGNRLRGFAIGIGAPIKGLVPQIGFFFPHAFVSATPFLASGASFWSPIVTAPQD